MLKHQLPLWRGAIAATAVITLASVILTSEAFSQSPAEPFIGTPFASDPDRTAHVTAQVVSATGKPVAGAVVVTSAGGQGASDADGMVRFAVDFDPSLTDAHITAVATIDGVNHVGSVKVDVMNTANQLRRQIDAGVIPISSDGECVPEWLPTFSSPAGMGGAVQALVVFDDGQGGGPALYAGGLFSSAGGVSANRIAKWDGMLWLPLGGGLNGPVFALAVFDDGLGSGPALYAGGLFSSAGGVSANRIAKWDGTAWSPLGTGFGSGAVLALCAFDDGTGSGAALYAGGNFTAAGEVKANHIARWDGSTWSAVGGGMNDSVYAITSVDESFPGGPALYVGGAFTTAGTVEVSRIARWDGTSWSALGDGVNSNVSAMTMFDDGSGGGPILFVGGSFTEAGGIEVNRVAQWNGTTWSAVGSGMNSSIHTFGVFDDGSGSGPALYAGGAFTEAGTAHARRVAKWDGLEWSNVGTGIGGPNPNSSLVRALLAFNDGSGSGSQLYAGGSYMIGGDQTISGVAGWDGNEWMSVATGMNFTVRSLTVFDDATGPSLYAGGEFTTAGGRSVNRIARWNNKRWSSLGGGMNATVAALRVFDDGSGDGPALYAGGGFTTADGLPANRVARWDGSNWSPLGSGLNGMVLALGVFDDGRGDGPALYAGGHFTSAGDGPANHIAKWDGKKWSALGTGTSGPVYALAVFDDGVIGPALFAGGEFLTAGGKTVNNIARWDGATWSSVGPQCLGEWWNYCGVNSAVYALNVFDDRAGGGPALYVGGHFTTAGGIPSHRIARWDGAQWSPVGSGFAPSMSSVNALETFDDGTGGGEALYVGGSFSVIAKWDGAKWSTLGSGLSSGGVLALTGFDDGIGAGPALYAGGWFSMAGGMVASRMARWQGCPIAPECDPADLNCDGVVDGADLFILLAAWGDCPAEPADCPADLDDDGVIDGADLLILLSNWG